MDTGYRGYSAAIFVGIAVGAGILATHSASVKSNSKEQQTAGQSSSSLESLECEAIKTDTLMTLCPRCLGGTANLAAIVWMNPNICSTCYSEAMQFTRFLTEHGIPFWIALTGTDDRVLSHFARASGVADRVVYAGIGIPSHFSRFEGSNEANPVVTFYAPRSGVAMSQIKFVNALYDQTRLEEYLENAVRKSQGDCNTERREVRE